MHTLRENKTKYYGVGESKGVEYRDKPFLKEVHQWKPLMGIVYVFVC